MVTKEYISAALRASHKVRKAILNGELPNLNVSKVICAVCNKHRATEYDHRDYDKPLEVQPVCKGCNAKLGKANFNPKNAPEPMEWSSVSVKIDKKLYDRIVKLADERGMLISRLIGRLIDQYLSKQKGDSNETRN